MAENGFLYVFKNDQGVSNSAIWPKMKYTDIQTQKINYIRIFIYVYNIVETKHTFNNDVLRT